MKYIKNTGRIALAFTIVKNDREFKIALDRRSLFRDSGNIATDGITPVEEAGIEELKKQKMFNDLVEAGSLEILKEADIKSPEETKVAKLEAEKKELEERLKKAEKADVKELEKTNKNLEKEVTSLKAQLEALTKDKAEASEDEAEASEDEAKDPDVAGF